MRSGDSLYIFAFGMTPPAGYERRSGPDELLKANLMKDFKITYLSEVDILDHDSTN